MHIENPDALKGWLTLKLAPLCDADPAALARYVLALLKKVKPEKELQECMKEQLDVFLGDETQPFLARLMDTIRTEDYLQFVAATEDPMMATTDNVLLSSQASSGSPAQLSQQQQLLVTKEDNNNIRPVSEDDTLRIDTSLTGHSGTGGSSSSLATLSGSHSPIKAPIVAPVELTQTTTSSSSASGGGGGRRQRLSGRSRSRSRSRSNERLSRTGGRNPRDSRDRLNRPSVNSNSVAAGYRNKSPPGRRFDHRRGMKTGGPGAGMGIDRYNRRNHSRSRSRSHSPSFRGKAHSRSLSPNHNHNNNNNNSGSQPEGGESRIQSQIVVGGGNSNNNNNNNNNLKPGGGKKCRDFEEKGYCMRGETCPWDHGVDPVVLEDINNPTLMTIQQQQHLREYNPDAPDLWPRNSAGGGGGFGPRGPRNGEFNPQRFRLSGGQPGGMMGPGGLSQLNRELIPVPVMMDGQPVVGGHPGMMQHHHHSHGGHGGHGGMGGGHGMEGGGIGIGGPKRRYEDQNQPMVPGMEGPPKRRPLAGRLGGRVGPGGPGGMSTGGGGNGGSAMQQNCSLELRKVPRGLNSIAHLNNHFSKFGKIINIQVNYEHDPEAAIVTFSSHAEANVAYRSTEAVLNNRFIKVFWHNNNNSSSSSNATNNNNNNNSSNNNNGKEGTGGEEKNEGGVQAQPMVRKGNQYHLNNVLNKQKEQQQQEALDQEGGGQNTVAAATTATVMVASPGQLRLKTNRGQALRRKQEEHVKAAVQMVKKKHELLQEYLKQMRSCLELIEKVDAMDPQRGRLLQTLKDLQGSIDKLRKEIAEEQAQLTAVQQMQQQQLGHHQQPAVRMTKEQQQKELLDLELELIAQQQEGNDISHIQRRIMELQRALGRGAAAPFQRGAPQGGGGPGGAMAGRGGRAVAPPGSTSVDRRPTTIFVAGFKVEDSDALLGHFKHFGEITKNILDQSIPSLIMSFAVRAHAEQAMQRGRIFKEKPLQINWYIPNFVKQQQLPTGDVTVEEKAQLGEVVKLEPPKEEREEGEAVKGETKANASLAAGEAVALKEEDEAMDGGGADSVKVEPQTDEGAIVSGIDDELPSAADGDDELRLDDEEEEEEDLESEERSWRR